MSAKSLWNWITVRALAGTPDNLSLFPFAPQPGTSLVTQAQNCTAAQIVTAGGVVPGDLIQSANVTLNDGQIKAGNPIGLAPGVANKIIVPLACVVQAYFSAGAYNNVDAAAQFGIVYAGPSLQGTELLNQAATAATEVTDVFTNAADQVFMLQPTPIINRWKGVADLITGVVAAQAQHTFSGAGLYGLGMVVYLNNQGSGALGMGNAGNQLAVNLKYLLVDKII